MSKKKHTREPIAIVHPKGNLDKFAGKIADMVADEVVKEVNRILASRGESPLKDK